MGSVALLLIGAGVFLFVMGLLVVKYAQFILSRLVERKHMAAEIIMQSGTVPPTWAGGLSRFEPLAGYAKMRALNRLRSIIRYFRVTPMVDDEETRTQILTRLEATLERWRTLRWSEILEQRLW